MLGPYATRVLMQAAITSSSLLCVDLAYNKGGDECITLLLEVIRNRKNLEQLYIVPDHGVSFGSWQVP